MNPLTVAVPRVVEGSPAGISLWFIRRDRRHLSLLSLYLLAAVLFFVFISHRTQPSKGAVLCLNRSHRERDERAPVLELCERVTPQHTSPVNFRHFARGVFQISSAALRRGKQRLFYVLLGGRAGGSAAASLKMMTREKKKKKNRKKGPVF